MMKNISLDVSRLTSRPEAHTYLAQLFDFPTYYGRNLDALHDCLSELGPTCVTVLYADDPSGYAEKVLRVMKDSERENPDLTLIFCNEEIL